MRATNTFSVKGYVIVRVLDAKTRKELYRYETPNVICTGFKTAVSKLLVNSETNADPVANQLYAIGAGDGTDVPDSSDTALSGTHLSTRKAFYTRGYNVGGVAGLSEITTIFENADDNQPTGVYYQEVALFTKGSMTTDQLMVARQLHAPIHKDSSIALEYTWRIQITLPS